MSYNAEHMIKPWDGYATSILLVTLNDQKINFSNKYNAHYAQISEQFCRWPKVI